MIVGNIQRLDLFFPFHSSVNHIKISFYISFFCELGARTLRLDTKDRDKTYHNGQSNFLQSKEDAWEDDIDWDNVDFNTIPLLPQDHTTSITNPVSPRSGSITGIKLGLTNSSTTNLSSISISTSSLAPPSPPHIESNKNLKTTLPTCAQPTLLNYLSIRPASRLLLETSTNASSSTLTVAANKDSFSCGSSVSSSSFHSNSSSNNSSTPVSGLPPTDDEYTYVSGAPQTISPEELLKNASSMHPFDPTAITSWIYPTNMPVRDYQFNIVQKALFNNTLVCIPTGLGKTLIAAVVMYNYFRWFPEGKVVFLAPTRPLVVQQQEACYKIAGIPFEETTVFVGNFLSPSERTTLWNKKRVFFATPQTFSNDLIRGVVPGNSLVCLVIDEAHKATGNYAYVTCVRELMKFHKDFRILALSATPGSSRERVEEVIGNLLINRIEIRTEQSQDVMPYTFKREKNTIVVQLQGLVKEAYQKFLEFLKPCLQRLYNAKAVRSNDPENINPFMILDAQRRYRMIAGAASYSIAGDFGTLHKLCTMAETLAVHSLRAFHASLVELPETIKQGTVRPYRPLVTLLQSSTYRQYEEWLTAQISKSTQVASHPKQEELERIVLKHFETKGQNSKVIIFAKFRVIVDEITLLLTKHHPLVRVTSFFGQAKRKGGQSGLKQREQIEIIKTFSKSDINTLVSTSVGEEGLDIGDVDLIICYDTSQSPIQMLQRMGRTGRKRSGHVICLLTAGKEESSYNKSQARHKGIQSLIQDPRRKLMLLPSAPRILPFHIKLVCIKMHMNIPPLADQNKKDEPLLGKSKSKSKLTGPFLSTTEMVQYISKFEVHTPLPKLDLSKFLDRQGNIKRYRIGPSTVSESFLSLITTFQDLKSIELASSQKDMSVVEKGLDSLEFKNNEKRISTPSQASSSSSDIHVDINLSFNTSFSSSESILDNTHFKNVRSSPAISASSTFLHLGAVNLKHNDIHSMQRLTDDEFDMDPGDEFIAHTLPFTDLKPEFNLNWNSEFLKNNPFFPKELANHLKNSSIPISDSVRSAIQPVLKALSRHKKKVSPRPSFSLSPEPFDEISSSATNPNAPHPSTTLPSPTMFIPHYISSQVELPFNPSDLKKVKETKLLDSLEKLVPLPTESQPTVPKMKKGEEPVLTPVKEDSISKDTPQNDSFSFSTSSNSKLPYSSFSSPSPKLKSSTKRRRATEFMPKFHVNRYIQMEADHSSPSSDSESETSMGSLVEFIDDDPDLATPTRVFRSTTTPPDLETPEFLRRYREIPRTPKTPSSSLDKDQYDMDDSFLIAEEVDIPFEGTQTLETLEEELEKQRFKGRKQKKKRRIQGMKKICEDDS
ncbi:hypothetical protein HMI56_006025 [Coelomomyces lativittatus]|nr:hypothetical protein HMI56_006025 [Coelomomyces lativittatus]